MRMQDRATKERHDAKRQLMDAITEKLRRMDVTDLEIVQAFVETL